MKTIDFEPMILARIGLFNICTSYVRDPRKIAIIRTDGEGGDFSLEEVLSLIPEIDLEEYYEQNL